MGLSLPHLIIFAVIIVLNFVPTIIAFVRKHEQKWLVFLLNLLLGWTGLGWIAALVWAIIGKPATVAADVGETFR